MRERTDYRDNLAQIKEATGGKLLISFAEAARILGVDQKALANTKAVLDMSVEVGKQRRLPVTGLARWMS